MKNRIVYLGLVCGLVIALLCFGCSSASHNGADGADGSATDADTGGQTDDGGNIEESAGDPGTDCGADLGADNPATTDDGGGSGESAGDSGQGDSLGDGSPDGGDTAANDGGTDASDTGPINQCIQGDFQAYFGNLHAHTSYSDGQLTPADGFAYARDTAHLDIQFITDHLEQLYQIPCLWDDGDYGKCREQADAATTDGSFVAGCGFEYGTSMGGTTGHNNVYFSDTLFPCVQVVFTEFYKTLEDCATCVGQFNHPGDMASQTWNDFAYDALADGKIHLFEFNGAGDTWTLFFEALDKGWHVAPQYNQDNHGANWGTANDYRSGVWLSALTRDALHQAMNGRRGFMTADKDANIKLMGDTTCWMGSILSGRSSLQLDAEAADAEPADGFATLEFWGPGKTQLSSIDCQGAQVCTGSYTLTVTAPTYILARAVQSDGDILVSAPIWVSP